MLFSSLVFLWYFLPAVCLLYFITKNLHIRNGVLLAASLFFYAWGEPKYVILMLVSIGLNYFFGLWVGKMQEENSAAFQTDSNVEIEQAEKKKETAKAGWAEEAEESERERSTKRELQGKQRMRLAVTACVALNLLLLGYFKYFNFAVEIANSLLSHFAGGTHTLSFREIALPVGISFYTFQALSYVVDVYRGTIQAQKNVFHLALYISFFPQLIAGPIVKYHDVCEQIGNRQCTAEGMAYGIKRFSYGLAKKMLFANTFAATVDWMMEKPLAQLGTVNAWMLAILYTLQIYFDFSGYSDMAIGLGKIFGFDFMENFNYPYISTSIREFWRRWHISLSTWFREYLYIPLGGNRKGQVRTYVNLLIVFFATGLWHGAGATFIIWGLYHGLFLVVERMGFGKWLEKNRFRGLNHLYTALVVVVGWVFFRADTLADAGVILHQMFTWEKGIYPVALFVNRKVIFLAVLGVLFSGIVQSVCPKLREHLYEKEVTKTVDIVIMVVLLFLCTMYLVSSTYNPFIYFRF